MFLSLLLIAIVQMTVVSSVTILELFGLETYS